MDKVTERVLGLMKLDFTPNASGKDEQRVAWAAEYSAYQLGQISKSLASIAESLKEIAEKP